MQRSPVAFVLAALAAVAVFFISESSYQEARSTFNTLGQEGEARIKIQVLWRSLADAETGERGFLLTGRPDYLAPYTSAQDRVAQSLDWLNVFYRNDPTGAATMGRVAEAARNKLAELAEGIKLYEAGRTEAWRSLMLSNIGKEQMDTVRSLSAQLLNAQTAKIATDRKDLARTLQINRLGVGAMTALSLLALVMYLRQAALVVQQREEQRRLLQAERDQYEKEVLLRTEQLTDLAHHLQSVREDERQHLARELHDELGALLTAAKLDVARLKSRLGVVKPEVSERLQHLGDGLNSGIALKRRIIEDLRPSSLSNLGLVAALEILVREWGQRSEIAVDAEFESVKLRPSGELTVYRLVQEALTNVTKYAKAKTVQVRLSSTDGWVTVLVRDDGVGFDTQEKRSSAHGLLGMRYRLESEGGRISMKSSPGEGTLIRADLPEHAAGYEPEKIELATRMQRQIGVFEQVDGMPPISRGV